MSDIREMINPHDKITIDYTDIDAARLAVLYIGDEWYGIDGDNGMPILAMGAAESWAKETYNKTLQEWADGIDGTRLATALESMQLVGERTSMSNPVKHAHELAQRIREKEPQ